MALAHAYAVTNVISGLPGSSLTISGASTSNRTRLVDGRIDKQYETGAAVGSWTIVIDAGSAVAANAFALLNHNATLAQALEVSVTGADDSGFSVNVEAAKASTACRTKDVLLQFPGGTMTKRYWLIGFQHSSMNLKIGEFFLCAATVLTRAITYGRRKAQVYYTTHAESEMGRQYGHFLSGPVNRVGLEWEDVSTTEKDAILSMHDAVKGNSSDLLWGHYWLPASATTLATDPGQECYYGRFLESEVSPVEVDYELWSGINLTLQTQTRGVAL